MRAPLPQIQDNDHSQLNMSPSQREMYQQLMRNIDGHAQVEQEYMDGLEYD